MYEALWSFAFLEHVSIVPSPVPHPLFTQLLENPKEVGKHWEPAFTKTASTRWQPQRQRARCWHPDEHNKHSALLIKFPYSALPQHTALKIRAGFSHIWERWPAAAAAPGASGALQTLPPALPGLSLPALGWCCFARGLKPHYFPTGLTCQLDKTCFNKTTTFFQPFHPVVFVRPILLCPKLSSEQQHQPLGLGCMGIRPLEDSLG